MKEERHKEIYQDYIKTLYSININIEKFENMFGLIFDINHETSQESIPYYVDYDFNTVAEDLINI